MAEPASRQTWGLFLQRKIELIVAAASWFQRQF
jgi:hypothetical protein